MHITQLIGLLKSTVLALSFLILTLKVDAKEYVIKSADQLSDLIESGDVNAGDVIIWTDGTYSEQEIQFQGVDGTEEAPITLRAQTSGGVKLKDNSTLRFGGSFLIVEGFHWEGSTTEETIVQFRSSKGVGATDCTLRNCAITDVTEANGEEIKWILVYGQRNTIKQCKISGKREKGAMIIVELGALLSSEEAGHQFEDNIFSEFEFSDGTNNETIRIGESKFQNWKANVIVQNNLFYKCDGENEIISSKSQGNQILNNTFLESAGSVVMRHGDFCHIEGNYFLGNGKESTGGVRIVGTNHTVVNNYFQSLAGKGWNGAVVIMNGESTGPTDNGYEKVEDVTFAHNTVVNCTGDVISYGWGRDAKGLKTVPKNFVFANNIVFGAIGSLIKFYDKNRPVVDYKTNIFFGTTIGDTDSGISEVDPKLKEIEGFFRPESGSPAANAGTSGYATKDIEGEQRGAVVDIGADEFDGATGTALHAPLTESDVGPDFLGREDKPDVVLSLKDELQNVEIFPNPVTKYLNIKGNGPVELMLYDELGRVKFIKNVNLGSNNLKINISDFHSGIYFLKIHSLNHTITKKVIIK